MSARLAGVGTALPPYAIDQAAAAALAAAYTDDPDGRGRLLRALYRRTGAQRRGSVLLAGPDAQRPEFFPPPAGTGEHGPPTSVRMARYAEEAPGLALRSCEAALAAAAVDPAEIRHLVTVSCTGFYAPGVDVALLAGLGLPATASRTHVGFMGCHGALNGLRVARALASAGDAVLLCALEVCSIHFQYGWEPEQVVANALFADGSGAVVVLPGDGPGWRLAASGSCLIPDSEEAMTWRVGDHGFQMTLSPRVPDLIGEHLRPWLEGWLADNGIGIGDVASWAIHPGGPRIVEAAGDALGLGREATAVSREVLAEHGNMSSPTILFILDRLLRRGSGTPCVALGFGPGLAAEALLLR